MNIIKVNIEYYVGRQAKYNPLKKKNIFRRNKNNRWVSFGFSKFHYVNI